MGNNKVECPFCGMEHERRNKLLNVICNCGCKYYAWADIWLNRKTGEYRKEKKNADH